jgi:lantibiotic biosynthesis protein
MSEPDPNALAAATALASALAEPDAVQSRSAGEEAWPQSLAVGASGVALLHAERARSGHDDARTAHAWLSRAVSGELDAANNSRYRSNVGLYLGAPALAFVMHAAAGGTSRYRRALQRLDEATSTLTRSRLAAAEARMGRGERPTMKEFDLIYGLTGLGAYHLRVHPDHAITGEVFAYLVRLTHPLTATDELPGWWTDVSPSGDVHTDFPHGHGNLSVSHGIGGPLALLSMALLRDLPVVGLKEAVERICAWTDHWRQHDERGNAWWPGLISLAEARDRRVEERPLPRPSWCYGIAGSARTQQLAGMALNDPARQETAERALLAVLRDSAQLELLPGTGLCHGMAGLVQSAWRVAADSRVPGIEAELSHLTKRLIAGIDTGPLDPEFVNGSAGAALALHTIGTGRAPESDWDAVLLLA